MRTFLLLKKQLRTLVTFQPYIVVICIYIYIYIYIYILDDNNVFKKDNWEKPVESIFCNQNFYGKLLTQSLKCKTHFLNVRTEFRVGNSFTCKCLQGSLTKFYYQFFSVLTSKRLDQSQNIIMVHYSFLSSCVHQHRYTITTSSKFTLFCYLKLLSPAQQCDSIIKIHYLAYLTFPYSMCRTYIFIKYFYWAEFKIFFVRRTTIIHEIINRDSNRQHQCTLVHT